MKDNPFVSMLCSYLVGPENIDSDTKQFKFVMTKDGVKKVIKNKIGTFVADVNEVPGLNTLSNGLQLAVPKIPNTLFQSMVSFFKKVMETKNGAEAMLQFFFDPAEGKYIAYCPKQTVSGGSVRYERNEEMENRYILVAEVHSHNTMSAFFSSVDNNDEKRTMVFGVLGKLDKPLFEHRFRISVGGEYQSININDIFDIPESEEMFPQEWMDNCKTATYGRRYRDSGGNTYIYDAELKKYRQSHLPGDFWDDFEDFEDVEFTNTGGSNITTTNKFISSAITSGKHTSRLPDKFDIEALDDDCVEELINSILMYRIEDLAQVIAEQGIFDELQQEVITKMHEFYGY